MMVTRKVDGALDESSADQEIRKFDKPGLMAVWLAG